MVRNQAGEILITRRPAHVHQGGLWEFPGGKCEAGETAQMALRRELWEELGIRVVSASPLIHVRHRYPDRSVSLEVFEVNAFHGHPHGREDQPLIWVRPEYLHLYPFPAADRPILNTLTLPPWYAVLEGWVTCERYRERFHALLDRGIKLIYWRARDLPHLDYQRLTEDFLSAAESTGVCLMIRSDSCSSSTRSVAGLHLNGIQLQSLHKRPQGWRRVAAACHCPEDLQRAESMGLDFAVLSPVLPTPTHSDTTPLGWNTTTEWLSRVVTIPVYVMGGLRREDLESAQNCGAHGIAGIRLFVE